MIKALKWRSVLSFIIGLVSGYLLILTLDHTVFMNAKVPTASMEHTIDAGDRLFVSRIAYLNDSPKRGDVIVFKYPEDEKQLFVKRVIGLPGETVEITEGKVYIDGDYIEESYVEAAHGDFNSYTVPDNSYFVMGDNRDNSYDSRYWGCVDKDKILGEVVFKYFPRIKKID